MACEMEILGAYQMMEDVIQVNSNKTYLRPWQFIFFLFFSGKKMCFNFFGGGGDRFTITPPLLSGSTTRSLGGVR